MVAHAFSPTREAEAGASLSPGLQTVRLCTKASKIRMPASEHQLIKTMIHPVLPHQSPCLKLFQHEQNLTGI